MTPCQDLHSLVHGLSLLKALVVYSSELYSSLVNAADTFNRCSYYLWTQSSEVVFLLAF